MIFKWKDNFSIGIEEIDKQHKRLFEIGGEIYNLAILKDGQDHYDEIIRLLNSLKDYTVYHFGFEENLMKKYNYEDIEKHKGQHDKFIEKLNEIETQDIDSRQKKVVLDILDFVINWISSHILGSDFKYKDIIK
ncbi:bacteriohemerythrin [Proteiniborus sp. MB09-C3]|uniref:bacteriohemerythrin n=1 Tax=Proteiniborus sp. MB09-C3 TaxID=3050072 RepID=UPI00255685C5|nr:bacteriohemerythrin [Proteiniborus sp. MB09-C3]WIV10652.1 bacteriohemerythrin [Proteiniborus sp. MB09-C3]